MSLITGVQDAYHAVTDTLFNLITGLGTAKDPRTSSHFVFQELNRNVLERMYRSDWLARRIVELPAADATREWRQWGASRPQLEKIDLLEKKLDIQKKMRQALIRARLYGGGAIVMGVDVGDPSEDLDLDDIGMGDLKFAVVLNRYELNAGPRIYNVDSPYYTRPEYYTVATPMFGFLGEAGGAFPDPKPVNAPINSDKTMQVNQQSYGMIRIHPSRVIEFSGNELPDWRLAPMGGGWGDSVLQTVDDALKDFAMIMGGLASMINDMKIDVVKVPDLTRKLSTTELTNATLKRFTMANQAKSTINTLLLDKEEEWQRIITSFGSTPELIKVAMTVACAAGGVPESRMMGSSPGKGLASAGSSGGEVDIENYNKDIESQQRSVYTPMLYPLDRAIQQSALGKYDPHISYAWNPLSKPSASELATVGFQKAQTTQVYVGTGLFNEDMLRESVLSQLTEDNIYPGIEDALDTYGSEPEEPEPEPAPPVPPKGFLPKGQFEPNPFHMLKAATAAKAGLPPPAPPGGAQKPGGPQAAKDAVDAELVAWMRAQGVPDAAIRDAIGGRLARVLDEDYRPHERRYARDYSESQPRGDDGKWTSGGGGGGSDLSVEEMAKRLAPAHGEMASTAVSVATKASHEFMTSPAVRAGIGAVVATAALGLSAKLAHGATIETLKKGAEFALDGAIGAVGAHLLGSAGLVAAGGVASAVAPLAIAVAAGMAVESLAKRAGITEENSKKILATTGRYLIAHFHALSVAGGSNPSAGVVDAEADDSVLAALKLLVPYWEDPVTAS